MYRHQSGQGMSVRRVSRPLSKKESLLLSTLSGAGETVFTIEDARAALGETETDVRKLLQRLSRKGWIGRLEGGTITTVPLAVGGGVGRAQGCHCRRAGETLPPGLRHRPAQLRLDRGSAQPDYRRHEPGEASRRRRWVLMSLRHPGTSRQTALTRADVEMCLRLGRVLQQTVCRRTLAAADFRRQRVNGLAWRQMAGSR